MNKLSLEESLKILAPIRNDDEEIVIIKNKTTRKTKKIKTPTRSPVRIPQISPSKKFSPREKIIPIENSSSLYDEAVKELEQEDLILDNKAEKKDIAPHTPTRIRIETPRTPTANFEDLPEISKKFNLKNKLREYRYSIIKYLIDNDSNSIKYAVCFDPNGQIIFIDLDIKTSTTVDDNNSVKIHQNEEGIIANSFQNAVLSNLTSDILGLVFYDNQRYLFSKRNDKGDFIQEHYTLSEENDNEEFKGLCHTYLLIRLSELEKEPQYVLQANKRNYQIIQQQMLLTNKETFNNLVNSVNNLTTTLKTFDKSYKKYSDNMIDDWCLLGTFSKEYYNKYSKGILTEEEKLNFDKVSVNMYARFQNFNEQIFMLYDMKDLSRKLDSISEKINSIESNIKNKDNLYSGKIIDLEEIENML